MPTIRDIVAELKDVPRPPRKPAAMWVDALAATAGIDGQPERTLVTIVAEQARTRPRSDALLSDIETFDYRTLQERVDHYANWALSQGLKKGDRVALLMPNRPEYVAAWLGIAAAGGVTALINTNLAGPALAHCIALARPNLAIVAAELFGAFEASLPFLASEVATGLKTWLHGEGPRDLPRIDQPLPETTSARPAVSIDDPALLIYTSGTTGLPKAARVSHRRIMNWALWFKGMVGADDTDRLYDCLPLYHSTGGIVAVGSLLAGGGAVAIVDKFSARRFWDDVTRFDCTLFQYIGELCRYLVNAPDHPARQRHRLRMAVGNGLRGDVWKRFQDAFGIPQILEFYAATEGNFSLYNAEGEPGAIGRIPPYLAHRFAVALVRHDDASGEIIRGADGFCIKVASGETGEAIGLLDQGSGRFEGYTTSADSERKIARDVFAKGDRWVRTGDLMRRDQRGFYYFVDRAGDTFRWKGENVSTNEVTEVISAAPGVVEAVVYGVTVAGAEGRAGMAKLAVNEHFDLAAFRSHVRQRLPSYAAPVFLRIGSSVAVTETFKPKKQDLMRDGFDPGRCGDPIYVDDPALNGYSVVDAAVFARIMNGDLRL
jgi:fatty-acyl-CoA synthase